MANPPQQPLDIYALPQPGQANTPYQMPPASYAPTKAPVKGTPPSVRAMQTFLRNHGYNIKVDGVNGPLTQAAAKDWRGSRNAKAWNSKFVKSVPTASSPSRPPDATNRPVAGGGVSKPGAGAGANPGQPTYNLPPANVGNLLPVNYGQNQMGNYLSPGMAGVGTPFDPHQAAINAGMEFDPQIAAIQNQINVVPGQTAQNLNDIKQWYAQVMGSLGTAQKAAATQGAAQTASLGNATHDIIQSMGGGANEGSGMVGDQGADAAALAGQIGGIESNFLSQEQPLLQASSAAASTQEQARQQAIARDLVNEQLSLKGAKGAKQSELSMQMLQYNNQLAQQKNQNLMSIRQYNNQIKQQAAQMGLTVRQYNNQLLQQRRQNASDNLSLAGGLALTGAQVGLIGKQAGSITKPGAFVPWDRLNPTQQSGLMGDAVKQIAPAGGLHGWIPTDPKDTSSKAAAQRVANQKIINQAKTSMRKYFMSLHYANPRLNSRIDQAINQAVKQAAALAAAGKHY